VYGYSDLGCSALVAQPVIGSNSIDFSNWEVGVDDKNCEGLGIVQIDDNGAGELSDLYIVLDGATIRHSTDAIINDLEPGNYEVLVVSKGGCEKTYDVVVGFDGNCEGDILYLVPNLDGPKQITFEDEGPIKIFNKAGFLLKSLDGPVVWDGTSEDGTLLPSGAYVMVFEDGSSKLLHVVD
jgi:hypothetical protein